MVLRNASTDGDFQNSPEVQALGLRSILCLPVIIQSEMIGLLYLENRLSEGVFTAGKTNKLPAAEFERFWLEHSVDKP